MPKSEVQTDGDKNANARLVKWGKEPLWYIGLLTNEQKCAHYFVAQDYDFIHLFHKGDNGNARCVAVFLYETARVKEIRDAAEADRTARLRWH